MLQQGSLFASATPPANRHWHDAGKGAAMLTALTVLPFMRRKVGFQQLRYGSLCLMTSIMLAFTWLVNFPVLTWMFGNGISGGDDTSLRLFALLFLGVGLWQRHQRKQEKWSPERPHAESLGVSWFADFVPLPEDYVYRFLDPAATCLAGALLRYRLGCPLLGLWWMVAAVALLIVEFSLYQQTELNDWGLGDRRKEAERDGDVLKAMTGQGEVKRTSRATYGIPTGSDGLEAEVERRKRERAAGAAATDGGAL